MYVLLELIVLLLVTLVVKVTPAITPPGFHLGVSFFGTNATNSSALQKYTVDLATSSVYIQACGASGASNAYNRGGWGGCIEAVLPVSPGQTLYVLVGLVSGGGNVRNCTGNTYPSQPNAILPGRGGRGGGSSDIRTAISMSSRILVAGGGNRPPGHNDF
jgi:Glycine rich protein